MEFKYRQKLTLSYYSNYELSRIIPIRSNCLCYSSPLLLHSSKAAIHLQAQKVLEPAVTSLEFYPSDSLLFTSTSETLKLWDTNQLEAVHSFDLHEPATTHAWSNDGKIAASTPSSIYLINPNTGSSSHILKQKHVSALAFNPLNPVMLVSGSADGIQVWDIRKANARIMSIDCPQVLGLVFSTDATSLFSAGRSIVHWNIYTGVARDSFPIKAPARGLVKMAITPSLRNMPWMLFYPSKNLQVIDIKTGDSKELLGHLGHVQEVCIGDEKVYSAGSADGVIEWSYSQLAD